MQAGLNKVRARITLARAVFIHRLGGIRDRSFRAAAVPRKWPELSDSPHRAVEYDLHGAGEASLALVQRAAKRRHAAIPVRLGCEQRTMLHIAQ